MNINAFIHNKNISILKIKDLSLYEMVAFGNIHHFVSIPQIDQIS